MRNLITIFAILAISLSSPAYAKDIFGGGKKETGNTGSPPAAVLADASYYAAITGTLAGTLKPGVTMGAMFKGGPVDLVAEVLIGEQGGVNLLLSKDTKGFRLLAGFTSNGGPGFMLGGDYKKWSGRLSTRTTSSTSCTDSWRKPRCSSSSKSENVISVAYKVWTK